MIVELGTSASARQRVVLHEEHVGMQKGLVVWLGLLRTQERHRMAGVEHPCLEVKLEAGKTNLGLGFELSYRELRGGVFVE